MYRKNKRTFSHPENSLTFNDISRINRAVNELRSFARKKYFQIIGEMPALAYVNDHFDPQTLGFDSKRNKSKTG